MNYGAQRLLQQVSQNIDIRFYEKTIGFIIEVEGNRIPLVAYRPSIHTIDPLIIRDRAVVFKELPEHTLCCKETTESAIISHTPYQLR